MNQLKNQLMNDMYEIYPTYNPVYMLKDHFNILCGADYNTQVFTFEKNRN